jgi:hypothetical protein
MSSKPNDADRPEGADDLEAWLREHPEAEGDLADLEHLREQCQSTWPVEPDDAAWTQALARINESVPAASPRRRRVPSRLAIILGLSAAAVLAVVLLARWRQVPTPVSVEEEFPVAEVDDVTIISMDARDIDALVVGEPPVTGELVFAEPADIRVIKCERCPMSGRLAHLETGEVPMFVSTIARAGDPDGE